MDITVMNAIIDFIDKMGFPIVMVAYFIWDKTKVTNRLTTVIENNNIILNKILTKIGADDLTKLDEKEGEK